MDEPYYNDERSHERREPHSVESERAILGAIILDDGVLLQTLELLEPEDFYVATNRKIFVAMNSCFERSAPITPITIAEELKKDNSLDSMGGVSAITGLAYGLPRDNNIEHYAAIIVGKARLRRLIRTARMITEEAMEEEHEPDVILSSAEHAIFQLTETRYKTQLKTIDETVIEVVEAARENIGHGMTITGIRTGLTDIDQITAGLQNSELILLAARPGIGKTALAGSIINNVTIRGEKHVAFFSLEMSRWSIISRMICSEARVNFKDNFSKGFLNDDELDRINSAAQSLRMQRIYLDDKPAISVLEVRAKLARMTLRHVRPDLVIIDYLQLMTGIREHRRESRQQEVSGIARELKSLAKEFNLPVLALAQLNRSPENRADKQPQLSDLRESGSLEQEADLVMFLYRDLQNEEMRNRIQLIVAKQRNGPTGIVDLRFDGPSMRFDNLYHE